MFMWGRGDEKDILFVVQSNGQGIWKQPVDHFWAENDGAALAMLPMDPAVRANKFNTDKAWDFFDTVRPRKFNLLISIGQWSAIRLC